MLTVKECKDRAIVLIGEAEHKRTIKYSSAIRAADAINDLCSKLAELKAIAKTAVDADDNQALTQQMIDVLRAAIEKE
jgi:hypothetical protein